MRNIVDIVKHYLMVEWGVGDGDEADIAARALVNLERVRARENAEAARLDADEIAREQVLESYVDKPRKRAARKKTKAKPKRR